MIDPDAEHVLTLTQAAAAYIQDQFGGKRPSDSTVARWCLRGLKGVRLESLKRGGHRVTSREAIARFFQRLAERDDEPAAPAEPSLDALLATAALKREGFFGRNDDRLDPRRT